MRPQERDMDQNAATAYSGRVNINTAGERELASVRDIGPDRARRIVEYRAVHGHFATIEELTNVPGFAESLTDDLRRTVEV